MKVSFAGIRNSHGINPWLFLRSVLFQGLVDYGAEEQDVEYSVQPQHEDGNGGKASVIGAVYAAADKE